MDLNKLLALLAKTKVYPDPAGNGDDVYKASNRRLTVGKHGLKPGEDEEEYVKYNGKGRSLLKPYISSYRSDVVAEGNAENKIKKNAVVAKIGKNAAAVGVDRASEYTRKHGKHAHNLVNGRQQLKSGSVVFNKQMSENYKPFKKGAENDMTRDERIKHIENVERDWDDIQAKLADAGEVDRNHPLAIRSRAIKSHRDRLYNSAVADWSRNKSKHGLLYSFSNDPLGLKRKKVHEENDSVNQTSTSEDFLHYHNEAVMAMSDIADKLDAMSARLGNDNLDNFCWTVKNLAQQLKNIAHHIDVADIAASGGLTNEDFAFEDITEEPFMLSDQMLENSLNYDVYTNVARETGHAIEDVIRRGISWARHYPKIKI